MTAASATDLSSPEALDPHFATIYREHVDYVWTNLRRLGVPTAELDDAVQETFLVAFRRRDAFREDASQRAWLFGIARRVAAHNRRSSGRRLRLVGAMTNEPSHAADPYDEVALRDAAQLVHHFLTNLPPRRREVFILAELEGYTGAEIAEALRIKPNTVWSRLRAARESFERYLGTLRAREHGAENRWDRTVLLRDAQDERAPERSRRRVMAALGAQLAAPGLPTMATGTLTFAALVKPTVLAIGLSAATLGSIAVGARLTRDESTHPLSPAHTTTRDASSPVSEPIRGATGKPAIATAPPPARVTSASREQPTAPSLSPPPSPRPSAAPAQPVRRGVSPVAPQATTIDIDKLAAELTLLRRLRSAAQDGRYNDVLAIAAIHERRFARGELSIERDMQRIAALCRLGLHPEAQDRIAAYTREHPNKTLPVSVATTCDVAKKKSTKAVHDGQEKQHE